LTALPKGDLNAAESQKLIAELRRAELRKARALKDAVKHYGNVETKTAPK
jgi:hypothetical protein